MVYSGMPLTDLKSDRWILHLVRDHVELSGRNGHDIWAIALVWHEINRAEKDLKKERPTFERFQYSLFVVAFRSKGTQLLPIELGKDVIKRGTIMTSHAPLNARGR